MSNDILYPNKWQLCVTHHFGELKSLVELCDQYMCNQYKHIKYGNFPIVWENLCLYFINTHTAEMNTFASLPVRLANTITNRIHSVLIPEHVGIFIINFMREILDLENLAGTRQVAHTITMGIHQLNYHFDLVWNHPDVYTNIFELSIMRRHGQVIPVKAIPAINEDICTEADYYGNTISTKDEHIPEQATEQEPTGEFNEANENETEGFEEEEFEEDEEEEDEEDTSYDEEYDSDIDKDETYVCPDCGQVHTSEKEEEEEEEEELELQDSANTLLQKGQYICPECGGIHEDIDQSEDSASGDEQEDSEEEPNYDINRTEQAESDDSEDDSEDDTFTKTADVTDEHASEFTETDDVTDTENDSSSDSDDEDDTSDSDYVPSNSDDSDSDDNDSDTSDSDNDVLDCDSDSDDDSSDSDSSDSDSSDSDSSESDSDSDDSDSDDDSSDSDSSDSDSSDSDSSDSEVIDDAYESINDEDDQEPLLDGSDMEVDSEIDEDKIEEDAIEGVDITETTEYEPSYDEPDVCVDDVTEHEEVEPKLLQCYLDEDLEEMRVLNNTTTETKPLTGYGIFRARYPKNIPEYNVIAEWTKLSFADRHQYHVEASYYLTCGKPRNASLWNSTVESVEVDLLNDVGSTSGDESIIPEADFRSKLEQIYESKSGVSSSQSQSQLEPEQEQEIHMESPRRAPIQLDAISTHSTYNPIEQNPSITTTYITGNGNVDNCDTSAIHLPDVSCLQEEEIDRLISELLRAIDDTTDESPVIGSNIVDDMARDKKSAVLTELHDYFNQPTVSTIDRMNAVLEELVTSETEKIELLEQAVNRGKMTYVLNELAKKVDEKETAQMKSVMQNVLSELTSKTKTHVIADKPAPIEDSPVSSPVSSPIAKKISVDDLADFLKL